jgi:hypothetical protein
MTVLREIYRSATSMEDVILQGMGPGKSLQEGLTYLRKQFFALPHLSSTEKHFADVHSGAAGKRLNMFLRTIKVV